MLFSMADNPFFIQRILIGFKAILEKTFTIFIIYYVFYVQLNPDGQPCLTEDLKGQQPGGGVQQQQEQVQGQPPQQRRQSQHHIHNNKGHNNYQQQVYFILLLKYK